MNRRTASILLGTSLLFALTAAPPALAATVPPQPALALSVTLSFSPNPVTVNTQTQIQVSIAGGVAPYLLWFNSTIANCNPPSQPFQQTTSSGSYPCQPKNTGNQGAHLDVEDSQGNHGSATATLNVQSSGSNQGGNNTGNNTNPFNLSGLGDILGILTIAGIVFLASTVAIAASAVALAVLVPRRLKQLRKAIEGQPMKKPEEASQAPPPAPAPPAAPKENLPKDDL